MAVAGYNIAFKLDTDQCTLAGRTQDDLTIAARIQERHTKDDQGSPQVAVSGHDITFRCTGIVSLDDSQDVFNRDYIIDRALSNSNSWDFYYLCEDGGSVSGECVITNYSESSNASDDATWTLDFRVVGTPTFTPAPAPATNNNSNP